MNYSFRELECFAAVATELSFTRAAEKLRLAQPPLSRHIRDLEAKLGARLFERTGRKVTLTAAGSLFFDETRNVLPQLTRAADVVRRFSSGEATRLRIGFVSAVLSPELVQVLHRFRASHPSVQLMMQDSPPAEQLEALGRGALDGGFVGLAPRVPTPGIQYLRWRKEPLAAFVPFDHRLARCRHIPLRELAKEPFIAVSSEAAPAFDLFVRDLCLKAGFRPRVVMESTRAQAVAVMVAAGAGVACLPRSLARVVGKAAAVLPLEENPEIPHVFARAAGRPSAVMRDFLRALE